MAKRKKSKTVKDADITVDRQSFMAFTEGTLLFRDSEGNTVIGDRAENYRAEELLEGGGVVLMTVDGKPYSIMRLSDDGESYVEEKL